MVDWSGALARKYDILQQDADTRRMTATADAANTAERTRLLGPTAQATIKLQDANAANVGQDTITRTQRNALAPDAVLELLAGRALDMGYPMGGNPRRDSIGAPAAIGQAVRTSDMQPLSRDQMLSTTMTPDRFQQMNPGWTLGAEGWLPPKRYARGTARVPGKGSSAVDSVPAKLAPDEAVLNQPAADMLGRGLIGWLNRIGAQQLGMPE